jgi:hypothetical protein
MDDPAKKTASPTLAPKNSAGRTLGQAQELMW